MSIPLDAKALLSMASTRSKERRNELALAMVDLFHDGDAILTERERAMMEDILHRLVQDMETAVRTALAERLASLPEAPHSLVHMLANDKIEVAWPILLKSRVLEDSDLIEIIYHRSLEHKLAIAQRGALSESVADALIHSGEERLIVTLLKNTSARLSQSAMEYLVEQAQRINSFQEPLVLRHELTDELARRMFGWVSAALRSHLAKRFDIDLHQLDDALEEVTTYTAAAAIATPGKETALVWEASQAGLLGPGFLVQALNSGDVVLFGRIIENLTGIRPRLARKLLFEAGGESLAALCHAIGLTESEFVDIYRIACKTRPRENARLEENCKRLAEFYGRLSKEASQAAVAYWRRNPDFLAAVRSIEMADQHRG